MAKEPIPVIPSLHNNSHPVLTNLGDQVAYVIRWFFANPGRTSSSNEDELISFRKLNSQFGNNPEQMVEKVATSLELICRRYSDKIRVTCTYDKKDHRSNKEFDPKTGLGILQGTYSMEIRVTDDAGEPIIPMGVVQISGENNEKIDLRFKVR